MDSLGTFHANYCYTTVDFSHKILFTSERWSFFCCFVNHNIPENTWGIGIFSEAKHWCSCLMTLCKTVSIVYCCVNDTVGNSWGRDWRGVQSCRTELFLARLTAASLSTMTNEVLIWEKTWLGENLGFQLKKKGFHSWRQRRVWWNSHTLPKHTKSKCNTFILFESIPFAGICINISEHLKLSMLSSQSTSNQKIFHFHRIFDSAPSSKLASVPLWLLFLQPVQPPPCIRSTLWLSLCRRNRSCQRADE